MSGRAGPPADLPRLEAGHVLELRETIYRIFRTGGAHPVSWPTFRDYGPLIGGRFDHHVPPKGSSTARAMLYGAANVGDKAANVGDEAAIATCLVEAFQATRVIDRSDLTPYLAAFIPTRPLRLLDLRHNWPARAGTTGALNAGPHSRSHQWSRKIYATYTDLDGLLYPSAVAGIGGANVALYERATDAMPRQPLLNEPLTHVALALPLRRAADRFGFDLI